MALRWRERKTTLEAIKRLGCGKKGSMEVEAAWSGRESCEYCSWGEELVEIPEQAEVAKRCTFWI